MDEVDGGRADWMPVPQDLLIMPEQEPPDASLPPDLGPIKKDGPCQPGCVERCMLVTGCNLYPAGPAQCVADCPGWSKPISDCLDQLICAGSQSCQAAAACITSPPVVDLVVKNLKATVQGTTVSYGFTVCNTGQLPSGGFAVDIYYNRTSPPPPKLVGDAAVQVPTGLAGGICAPLTAQRKNTPPGDYASWVQVDGKGVVQEVNENNNFAGPVQVKIEGPKAPDLVIKKFDVTFNGADIVYDVEVCNVGSVGSWLFRLDIYYNRLLAPTPLQIGDQNVLFLTGLAAGACKTVSRTYKTAPVGMKRSWALADSLNTVKESNEGNNVAGPKLTVVSPQSGCISLCTFATGCGLFKITEFAQCLTWCNGLSTSERACADAAAQAVSCADLKQCSLPPPPPPPPPPWACLQICNHLVQTCKLVPQNQYLTCVGGCITLPQTKVQCAMTAMDNGQCLQMSLCLF